MLKCFHVLHIHLFLSLASRILFKDKERKWEEIEIKLQTEHDSLVLKSSNKVMNLPHIPAFQTDQMVIVGKYVEPGWRVFFSPLWSKLKCLF